jgi:hypothetical protein
MTAALPPRLAIQSQVRWSIHRMQRANNGHPEDGSTLIEGEDYGNDDGYAIVPQPETYTRYAISCFLPENVNHLYPHSELDNGKCWMVVADYNLPEGLGIVYDRTLELKYQNRKMDKKDPQTTVNYHFSLICTRRMPLQDYFQKVLQVFSMPHVMPCRIFAGTDVELLKSLDPNTYGDDLVAIILSTVRKFFEKTEDPVDKYNCIALHTWIEDQTPTFDQLLSDSLFSRIAFNILGKHDDSSATALIRIGSVHDEMGKKLNWDTN